LEKDHQVPDVDDDRDGNVIVLDGPAVNRKVVAPKLDDAVRSTVVPDTLEVTYLYEVGAWIARGAVVLDPYSAPLRMVNPFTVPLERETPPNPYCAVRVRILLDPSANRIVPDVDVDASST
jgi:hypothetical protein